MADLALYRKHRPSKFAHLVGQDPIQKTLLNAIKSGHLAHAYLFCGPRGTGKTTTARLVAKAINCISPDSDGESCNQCEYCTLMNKGSLVDLIEIDAASNRGIDEIRDLREKIKFSPSQAPHKVYIIDEVHMLTTPAFNALLKTLEEPPSHAYFILATTEAHKIPETIISRCQRFDFRRIDLETTIEHLKHIAKQERIDYEDDAIELLARVAEGGMRDAIGLMDQLMNEGQLLKAHVENVLGVSGHSSVQKILQAIEKQEMKTAVSEIQFLYHEGHDLYQFNRSLLHQLRQHLLASVGKIELTQKYLHWIDLFQKAAQDFRQTLIPQLPLEVAILKACMMGQSDAPKGWLEGLWTGKNEKLVEVESGSLAAAAEPHLAQPNSEAKIVEKDGLKLVPEEGGSIPSPTSIDELKQHFPRILDHVKTASVRQSLRTALITQVQGETIFVEFNSKFHLEKVDTTANKSEVEAALETVFGKKMKIECRLTSMTTGVDKTLEIFGGEVLD